MSPSDSAQAYWKGAIFIPYLDGLILQLSDRFNSLSCQAVHGLCLLPANLKEACTEERTANIIEYFRPDMPSAASAMQEIRLWKRFWADHSNTELPTTISDTIQAMNAWQFPSIHAVLHVLLLLPVTSAEVERAHSAFRLIKTSLHSRMGEERLNALIRVFHFRTSRWRISLSRRRWARPYTT